MWNSAEPMPFTRFRRVESLLHRTEIADRNIGLLHLRHPILELVACKDARNSCAQFLLVGRSCLAVGKLWIRDEVRPFEDLGHEPTIESVVGAGHVEWPVRCLI